MEFCYHCFQCMCTTTTTTCAFSCCFDYLKLRSKFFLRLKYFNISNSISIYYIYEAV